MINEERLNQLVELSSELGTATNDYVILGEGNTSARFDENSFLVKGSAPSLNTIDTRGFVRVNFKRVLDIWAHLLCQMRQ